MAAIKDLNIGEGKRVVFVCPDSVRNYITKFINNDWMYENGFISEKECMDLTYGKLVPNTDWGQEYTVKDLNLTEGVTLTANTTVKEAIDALNKHNFD